GGTNKGSAPFRVTADGALTATNATITGSITVTGGNAATTTYADSAAAAAENAAKSYTDSGLAGKINTGGAAADVNAGATTITGSKITTGTITAAHINVTNLASIVADLGAITAGSITLNTAGFIRSGATS